MCRPTLGDAGNPKSKKKGINDPDPTFYGGPAPKEMLLG
jgi:hypothetical protein